MTFFLNKSINFLLLGYSLQCYRKYLRWTSKRTRRLIFFSEHHRFSVYIKILQVQTVYVFPKTAHQNIWPRMLFLFFNQHYHTFFKFYIKTTFFSLFYGLYYYYSYYYESELVIIMYNCYRLSQRFFTTPFYIISLKL